MHRNNIVANVIYRFIYQSVIKKMNSFRFVGGHVIYISSIARINRLSHTTLTEKASVCCLSRLSSYFVTFLALQYQRSKAAIYNQTAATWLLIFTTNIRFFLRVLLHSFRIYLWSATILDNPLLYLSIFKFEAVIEFFHYINKTRIEKAKELILATAD